MKRLFLVLVLFGAGGLALFAAWAGMSAKTGYAAAVHEAGGHPDVRVIETAFRRGWTRSSGETSVEIHGQVGAAFRLWMESLGAEAVRGRVGLRMRHEFVHGPASLWSWIVTGFQGAPSLIEVRTWIELDNESKLDAEPLLGEMPPVLAFTRVHPGGTVTELLLLAGESAPPSGARVASWQELAGRIEPHGPLMRSFGRLNGFHGDGSAMEIHAQALDWEVSSTRGSRKPAEIAIRMPSLAFRHKVEGAPWIVVHDIELGQAAAGSHGRRHSTAYARFVRAEIGDEVYGPGRFEIVAEAPVAEDALPAAPEPDLAARKVGRQLEVLPGFVLRAPRAEFTRLFVNTPHGPLRGGGDLELAAGNHAILAARLDLEAPIAVLEGLRGAWLPGASHDDAWFTDWESKGLLRRGPDGYRLRARVRGGTLTLNRVAAEEVFTFADEDEEAPADEASELAGAGEAGTGETAEAAGGTPAPDAPQDGDVAREEAEAAASEGAASDADASARAADPAPAKAAPEAAPAPAKAAPVQAESAPAMAPAQEPAAAAAEPLAPEPVPAKASPATEAPASSPERAPAPVKVIRADSEPAPAKAAAEPAPAAVEPIPAEAPPQVAPAQEAGEAPPAP